MKLKLTFAKMYAVKMKHHKWETTTLHLPLINDFDCKENIATVSKNQPGDINSPLQFKARK